MPKDFSENVYFRKDTIENTTGEGVMDLRVALRFASPNSPLVYLKICRITIIAQANFVFSYENKIERACNNRLA